MKNKLCTIMLIAFLSVGLLGIATIILGIKIENSIDIRYANNENNFLKKEKAIEMTFSGFGAGNETNNAVTDFIQSIPGSNKQNNNIVIVDRKGSIFYKANDNYLHGMSGPLGIAGKFPFVVIFDQATNGKYCFVQTGFDGMSYGLLESDDNTPGFLGNIDTSRENINQISLMLNAYSAIDKPEADLDIINMDSKQGGPQYYILWFRNIGEDNAIYASFGRNDESWGNYLPEVGLLLIALYWLLAPVWVFLDARRRQVQPLPWALLVLLTNVVGLVVYWIVQSQYGRASTKNCCPACGKTVHKSHIYCPWCAAPLVKACKGCGKALEREWVACPWCGKSAE